MIPIGGTGMQRSYVASGKVTLFARTAGPLKSPVSFYADNALIATVNAPPYLTTWDTTTVPDGPHKLTASAVNEKGETLWQGEATVTVDNKNASKIPLPPPPAASKATGPVPPVGKGKPGNLPGSVPPGPTAAPAGQLYSNEKYGFQLMYPAGWKAADHTKDMKPKWKGGFWIVFTPQSPDPKLTINLRHRKLDRPTTPENYVKYNGFLASWTRTEVAGMPAFKTTQGSQESKRVLHRALIVDGEHIWMLNCVDETGGSPAVSQKIFEDLLASLSPLHRGTEAMPGLY